MRELGFLLLGFFVGITAMGIFFLFVICPWLYNEWEENGRI